MESKKEVQRPDVYLKIWDCPRDVAMDFFSFAKQNAGNKLWVALKLLLEHAKKTQGLEELSVRVEALEQAFAEQIAKTQVVEKQTEEEDGEIVVPVFGTRKEFRVSR